MSTPLWIGAVVAALYVVAAIYVIHSDRTHSSGGWINPSGFVSGLATLPIAALVECVLRRRLNHRSNIQMGLAVLGTAAIVGGLAALVAWPFAHAV
jgi:hypothetical protein